MINLYINHNIYKHAITQTIKQVKKAKKACQITVQVVKLRPCQKCQKVKRCQKQDSEYNAFMHVSLQTPCKAEGCKGRCQWDEVGQETCKANPSTAWLPLGIA